MHIVNVNKAFYLYFLFQAQLFEGLDDADSSFGDDTFVPRKSVKKLMLRKGSGNKSTSDSSSFYDVDVNNSQLQQPITR